jgi:hypothetical protein
MYTYIMPLNKNDLRLVRQIVEEVVEEVVEEKNKNLPTKDEFFNSMDQLITELKANRQEQTFIVHRLTNHENRIQKVEKHLSLSTP